MKIKELAEYCNHTDCAECNHTEECKNLHKTLQDISPDALVEMVRQNEEIG